MKKFKFQLETLLTVTRMNKEQAEVKLAEATKDLEEKRAYLSQLLEEMAQGHRDYERLTTEGTITVGTLMTYNSFFNWKRNQIENQQQLIMQAQDTRQKRMRELVAIMNKLKSSLRRSVLENIWQSFSTRNRRCWMRLADSCISAK